jgi:hypothetical protein
VHLGTSFTRQRCKLGLTGQGRVVHSDALQKRLFLPTFNGSGRTAALL